MIIISMPRNQNRLKTTRGNEKISVLINKETNLLQFSVSVIVRMCCLLIDIDQSIGCCHSIVVVEVSE
jgi:hypothetical protein